MQWQPEQYHRLEVATIYLPYLALKGLHWLHGNRSIVQVIWIVFSLPHLGNGWECWSLPLPFSVSCCRKIQEDIMPELSCAGIHLGDNIFSSALQSPAYTMHWREIYKGNAGSKSFWQCRMKARNSQRKYNTCFSYSYTFSYKSALGHCQRHEHLIQGCSAASIVHLNLFLLFLAFRG